MNTYIDPYDYLGAASGHDTSNLIGTLTRVASTVSAGTLTIPLTSPLVVKLNAYDTLTIFDGSSSEVLKVGVAGGNVGDTWISLLTGTQYAHNAGVALSTPGIQGDLGALIIKASAAIERYCNQPLLQASVGSEKLPLRSTRAAVTRDYQLLIRPKQFPVQSVASLALQLESNVTLTLDASQAAIDADAQLITVQQMTTVGGSVPFWGSSSPPAYPATPGFVLVSYTAGYAYSALPADVKQAAIWLTSSLLADRYNPYGAIEIRLGKRQIKYADRQRGPVNSLISQAHDWLDSYRQRLF